MKRHPGAYAILSSLTVSGDAVDAIAAIRAKLRRVVEFSAPEEIGEECMADKTIGSLPVASQLDNDSMLVVEQQSSGA